MARNIRDWQYEAHKTAKNKGWWDPQSSPQRDANQKLAVLAILHRNLSAELEAVRTGTPVPVEKQISRTEAEQRVRYLHPDKVLVLSKLALIHSELSEAVESVYDSEWADSYELQYAEGSKKPEGLLSELADVVIRCLDLAAHLGIELSRGMSIKHRFNKIRTHRHGNKLA